MSLDINTSQYDIPIVPSIGFDDLYHIANVYIFNTIGVMFYFFL